MAQMGVPALGNVWVFIAGAQRPRLVPVNGPWQCLGHLSSSSGRREGDKELCTTGTLHARKTAHLIQVTKDVASRRQPSFLSCL